MAVALVEAACAKAEALGAAEVTALQVRVGALSGVVPEALRFGFELAARGTRLERARIEIEEVPVSVRCPRCREDRALPGPQSLRCPVCATPAPHVVAGRELELHALEIEDDAPAHR